MVQTHALGFWLESPGDPQQRRADGGCSRCPGKMMAQGQMSSAGNTDFPKVHALLSRTCRRWVTSFVKLSLQNPGHFAGMTSDFKKPPFSTDLCSFANAVIGLGAGLLRKGQSGAAHPKHRGLHRTAAGFCNCKKTCKEAEKQWIFCFLPCVRSYSYCGVLMLSMGCGCC